MTTSGSNGVMPNEMWPIVVPRVAAGLPLTQAGDSELPPRMMRPPMSPACVSFWLPSSTPGFQPSNA